ncbi:MAG: CHRD domain-containing protein [Phenylobacterium sp.]|uniref:CHRD domain-containing protein n=1 Tax=Phenylobacterium sp. TaxID=1871053 RepID=UPI0025F14BE8|nr:CHRD domain-containing protein [Phenylobacterium sp.]MBI1199322.1 CHRD domain-containing protein [Phenylobacterium sp.]
MNKAPYRTLALALAAAGLAGAAQADPVSLSAHLTGAAEKPTAGDPDGMGHATLKVDTAKNEICYTLMVENIGQPLMAHIHKGGPDAAGPVAVPLTPPDSSGKSAACVTADAAVVKDIADNPGGYYVNVHTADFKAGAVRGQVMK